MPDPRSQRARFCSQCGSAVVVDDASFCKECGAPLPNTVWLGPAAMLPTRKLLLLSLIPGLGHWYKGQRLRGIAWFFAVMLFYTFPLPIGFLMHAICAGNAAFGGTLRDGPLAATVFRRHQPRQPANARASR
jgi:hypothetical protein